MGLSIVGMRIFVLNFDQKTGDHIAFIAKDQPASEYNEMGMSLQPPIVVKRPIDKMVRVFIPFFYFSLTNDAPLNRYRYSGRWSALMRGQHHPERALWGEL